MSEESEKRRAKLEEWHSYRARWGQADVLDGLAYVMETQIKILEWIEKHEEEGDLSLFGTNIRRNSLFR